MSFYIELHCDSMLPGEDLTCYNYRGKTPHASISNMGYSKAKKFLGQDARRNGWKRMRVGQNQNLGWVCPSCQGRVIESARDSSIEAISIQELSRQMAKGD